jgi:hypothetical protein
LGTLAAADVTDGLLHELWRIVFAMHETGIVHGGLDADRIFVAPDGSARITGFQAATASPSPQAILADRARLLVTTALIVGDDRAVGRPSNASAPMRCPRCSHSSIPPP